MATKKTTATEGVTATVEATAAKTTKTTARTTKTAAATAKTTATTKTTTAATTTETETAYWLDTLRIHCRALFGVSSTLFAGATAGLDKTKKYTKSEIITIINEWKSKEAK